MPNVTPNYGLGKPLVSEKYDVNVLNGNTDKVDTELKKVSDRVDAIITTPVGGVSAQEVIDARQGEVSLGANINGLKSQLAETKTELETSLAQKANDADVVKTVNGATPDVSGNVVIATSGDTNGHGTLNDLPLNPAIADMFFLVDSKRRVEWNGEFWQKFDGGYGLAPLLADGNIYPMSLFNQSTYGSAAVINENAIDISKDFIAYFKVKLADNDDYFHLSFKVGGEIKLQVTFGYDWITETKNGKSISVYDYVNPSGNVKLGDADLYTEAKEVIVWYDKRTGYINVYINNVLIGSYKPVAGGIVMSQVTKALILVGSGTTLVTFDYLYMAYPLVTVIGDSITGGAVLHAPNPEMYVGVDNYTNSYAKYVSDSLKARMFKNYFVVNKGVNSNTTGNMKARFAADIIATGCKMAMIHGGINDYQFNDVALTINNKLDMYEAAKAANIAPVLLGIMPTKIDSISNSHQYAINVRAAEATGYINKNHIILWGMIEGSTQNVADSLKMADTVHPNTAGYEAVGGAIGSAIASYLAG